MPRQVMPHQVMPCQAANRQGLAKGRHYSIHATHGGAVTAYMSHTYMSHMGPLLPVVQCRQHELGALNENREQRSMRRECLDGCHSRPIRT